MQLRRRERYVGWPIVLAGDVNSHFAELTPSNARYEGPLERDVLRMLRNPDCFGGVLKNPPGVATHVSGTIVDVVNAPQNMAVVVDVVSAGDIGVRSDHACVLARLPGTLKTCIDSVVGSARWLPQGDWAEALELAPRSLEFVAGWAGAAMRCPMVRKWTATGEKWGVRQSILDQAVWWRAVVYTLFGHFAGLVVAAGPRGRRRVEGTIASLQELLQPSIVGCSSVRGRESCRWRMAA